MLRVQATCSEEREKDDGRAGRSLRLTEGSPENYQGQPAVTSNSRAAGAVWSNLLRGGMQQRKRS